MPLHDIKTKYTTIVWYFFLNTGGLECMDSTNQTFYVLYLKMKQAFTRIP